MLEKIILRNKKNDSWRIFSSPKEVLYSKNLHEVKTILDKLESKINENNDIAVGFLTYESAPAFDPAYRVNKESKLPLICFGLFEGFKETQILDNSEIITNKIYNWKIETSPSEYKKNFDYIKNQIELGYTYQINYTLRSHSESIQNPYEFFLEKAKNSPFAAYIETDENIIISASPELFFSLENKRLFCKPMKGTSRRGKTFEEDLILMDALRASKKNKAENIMITDMLRNDMGRISEPGSVKVSSKYDIEKYSTVWQMTSSVESETTASITEIFQALYPCASVTGAPKIASMDIISRIEELPRGIYTGAIGYIAPNREAEFSVPIRTVVSDKNKNCAVYGTGGGIVWDSVWESEWDECLTKSKVLSVKDSSDFELFETMKWDTDSGVFLEEYHFNRLKDSASYFDFKFCDVRGKEIIDETIRNISNNLCVIRLFVNAKGGIRIETSEVPVFIKNQKYTVSLAKNPVQSENIFLYHKTTQREVYENAEGENLHSDDVILWNEEGNLTESTIANIILNIKGNWVTPSINCGLLRGVYRESMLENGLIEERKIHKSEIADLSEITLINSVRGEFKAKLI
jgi:para-aminobenzoate synthetase/4-amino-4-deoxychorismate lyase